MLTGLNHLTLAVTDVERSVGFYRDLLGFELAAAWDGGAYLALGDLWLCASLDPSRAAATPDIATPGVATPDIATPGVATPDVATRGVATRGVATPGVATPGADYTHYAFSLAQQDFAPFCARLRAAGAREWRRNRSEGDSFYFLDPDGHQLEAHVGDLASRLARCRAAPYAGMRFADDFEPAASSTS